MMTRNERAVKLDLSVDYANADFIPDAAEYPPRWLAKAAEFRAQLESRARCGIPYGDTPRQTFDLFLPETTPVGLLVFIHGGYWLDFSATHWSHFAAGALARDWAVAMPSYTLAPQVRIHQITAEVAAAITAAAAIIDGPIVITGHSAGGHLSARMACTDIALGWGDRLARVVPISPVADLRPLMFTDMNAQLRIDQSEAEAESPALLPRHADVDCTVWVGAQERPAFLWQARTLSENWDCPWHAAPGKHHFDVLDDLEDSESLLIQTLLD